MKSVEIPEIDSISIIVEKIKSGEISIVDLVKEHVNRAKETNKVLNAFISILDREAIKTAEELELKLKENPEEYKNKKLLGIPFSVKDLYLVENTQTTFASKLMEGFIAPYTATVVQKCLDEGAILIGKCNCDPWGFGGSGENSGYGATKHPMDLTRVPGGSSSGSAASLAGGVGFFSLGTDTGGSVRLPASFCGLHSLKPTYGRNSRFGISAMGSSFDTPGFFARHPEDIELLEIIMQGKDTNDATTHTINESKPSKDQKYTIGIIKEFFEDSLNKEIKDAIYGKIGVLKELGHTIREVSIPNAKSGLAVYYTLVPAEISSNRARYDGVRYGVKVSDEYTENMVQSRSQLMEDEVKRRIMIGTYVLSAGYGDQIYQKATLVRSKLKEEFREVFKEVDILLSPVTTDPPFKLGERISDPVKMYLIDLYTVLANIVGIPALAVPIGRDKSNLPIGMQFMGKWDRDMELIEIAKTIPNE